MRGHVRIYNASGLRPEQLNPEALKNIKPLWEKDNLIVNTGLTLVLNRLLSDTALAALGWCSIGTGTTAPTATDTQLTTETARNQITSWSVAADEATILTFFSAGECGVYIKELGLWGGLATATLNSGTLHAHTLASYDNSSSPVDLVISWVLTEEAT